MLGLIKVLMVLIATFFALKCCLENHRLMFPPKRLMTTVEKKGRT